MALNLRGRKTRYDNISVGNATGRENTISGNTVSYREMSGGGFQTSTSTGDVWHSNIAKGSSVSDQVSPDTPYENIVAVANVTGDENVKVGG